MTQKAPGKFERGGISLLEFMQMFPNNETSLKWLENLFGLTDQFALIVVPKMYN